MSGDETEKEVWEEASAQGLTIEAQSDFMTVTIKSAGGQVKLLEHALKAANHSSNKIGKCLLSHSAEALAILCYSPQGHSFDVKTWIEAVLSVTGGSIVHRSGNVITASCTANDGVFKLKNGKEVSQGEAVGFEATAASVAVLRDHGLFPPKEPESDDDFPDEEIEW